MLQRLLQALGLREPEPIPPTRAVYLRPDDDLASVLDRLDWIDVDRDVARAVLVIPPDVSLLNDRLALLRVRREARRRPIDIALVTLDPDQRALARELAIPVFFSVERAGQSPWGLKPLSPTPTRRRQPKRPPLRELRPGDSRVTGYILLGLTMGVALTLGYDLLTLGQLDFDPQGRGFYRPQGRGLYRLLQRDALTGALGGVAAGLLVFLLTWLLRRYAPRLYRWVRWGFMALVFAFGLLAPLIAGYFIVPGARLELTPAREPVSAIARITVVVPLGEQGGLEEAVESSSPRAVESSSSRIDFEGQRIAGRRVAAEVGGEATSAATGAAEVPSSRATGTVIFSNLLAQDYTLAQGTVVRTSAGTPVRFITTGDVTVPPSGRAAVGIEALEPGPQGNVGVGLINQVEGAVARAVRVTNPEPTRGGGVSQVRAVTEEDREELRQTLLAQLRSQGYQRVAERPQEEGGLREGEYLVPGSVRVFQVLHETYDRFATEEAESVKLEMRVLVTGVVVDLGDAYNLTRHVLQRQVPEGYELLDVRFAPGLMGDNVLGNGTLTFFVEADGVAEARLHPDRVKRWLRGVSFSEGMARLEAAWQSGELPTADLPEVEIWPDWAADRFPWLVWRIQVVEREAGALERPTTSSSGRGGG